MNISPAHSWRAIIKCLKETKKIAASFESSGQHKPIYQGITAQNKKEDKGYYIHNPQPRGFSVRHLFSLNELASVEIHVPFFPAYLPNPKEGRAITHGKP
jgi:hypothetical protein